MCRTKREVVEPGAGDASGTLTPPFQDLKKTSAWSPARAALECLLCSSTAVSLGQEMESHDNLLSLGCSQKNILVPGLCHALALLGAQHPWYIGIHVILLPLIIIVSNICGALYPRTMLYTTRTLSFNPYNSYPPPHKCLYYFHFPGDL